MGVCVVSVWGQQISVYLWRLSTHCDTCCCWIEDCVSVEVWGISALWRFTTALTQMPRHNTVCVRARWKFVLHRKLKQTPTWCFILPSFEAVWETGNCIRELKDRSCFYPPASCLQVTCLACDHRSNTVEPFWDLSLEFPERYHSNSRESAAQASCHLTEMLAKFTETEALEGNIYACDHCNCEWSHVNVHAIRLLSR